jgi:hypothetical protein
VHDTAFFVFLVDRKAGEGIRISSHHAKMGIIPSFDAWTLELSDAEGQVEPDSPPLSGEKLRLGLGWSVSPSPYPSLAKGRIDIKGD